MALSAIFTIGLIRYATVADSNSSRTKSLDKYTIRAAKATTRAQMIEGGGIHPAELDPLGNLGVFIDGPSVTGNAFRSHSRFFRLRKLAQRLYYSGRFSGTETCERNPQGSSTDYPSREL